MSTPGRPYPTRVYSLDPASFNRIRIRVLRQRAILFFAVLVVGILAFVTTFGSIHADSLGLLVGVMVFVLIIVIALVTGIAKGLKREKEAWSSYSLTVGIDFVKRRMNGYPELEISANQISAIKESSEGIAIVGPTRDDCIFIHRALENFEEVRAHIANWSPVPPVAASTLRARTAMMLLIPLAIVALFAILFLSNNPKIEIATGIPLLFTLPICALLALKSKQLPDKTKRSMLLVVLPLIGVIGRLVDAFHRLQ